MLSFKMVRRRPGCDVLDEVVSPSPSSSSVSKCDSSAQLSSFPSEEQSDDSRLPVMLKYLKKKRGSLNN